MELDVTLTADHEAKTAPPVAPRIPSRLHIYTHQESRRFVRDLEQLAQLEQVLGVLPCLGSSVLAGDFNFIENTPFHCLAETFAEDVARGLHPPGLRQLQPKLDHIFVRGLGWRKSLAKWVIPGLLAGPMGAVSLSGHAGVSVELELADLPYPTTA
jgi:endonuclease/exonuclease/phosphatase family metal-dependent hydrolase